MRQTTLSDFEYSNRRRKTRREQFLDVMDSIVPWDAWIEEIRPYYPSGRRGRPPKNIEKMLRMYLMQRWFDLSDEGIEDAIYDSYAMRKFMHIDFLNEQVPDSTTLLKFRHLMEKHDVGMRIDQDITERLVDSGRVLRKGTIVDPKIITISSSSRSSRKQESTSEDNV
jgi:IS5 family transposase